MKQLGVTFCISLSNSQNESNSSCFVSNLSWSINIYLEKTNFHLTLPFHLCLFTCVKRNANCSFLPCFVFLYCYLNTYQFAVVKVFIVIQIVIFTNSSQ